MVCRRQRCAGSAAARMSHLAVTQLPGRSGVLTPPNVCVAPPDAGDSIAMLSLVTCTPGLCPARNGRMFSAARNEFISTVSLSQRC
jgi:hypothetical protein